METPLIDHIQKQKNFSLEVNSQKYNLSFILNSSSINIILENKNSFLNGNFEQNYSYNSFCKKSKIFKIYDNINEIYESLLNFMEKKKYSIDIKDSSAFLNFNLDVGNFSLELFIKKSNINDSLNVLTEKIKYLLEENERIKNKMNSFEEENKELKNRIINLEKGIKDIDLFEGSTIIQTLEEKKLISNWIIRDTKIYTQLIYKAKRDGDKASDFHSKCDNRGPTITIIQTIKGSRFGGYTSISWTSPKSSNWPGDGLAFVFSLDLKQKFEVKNKMEAIGHYSNNGPVFGYGHCFEISSECLNNEKSYHLQSESYQGTNSLILTKESYFKVADYEVFQIKFQ